MIDPRAEADRTGWWSTFGTGNNLEMGAKMILVNLMTS